MYNSRCQGVGCAIFFRGKHNKPINCSSTVAEFCWQVPIQRNKQPAASKRPHPWDQLDISEHKILTCFALLLIFVTQILCNCWHARCSILWRQSVSNRSLESFTVNIYHHATKVTTNSQHHKVQEMCKSLETWSRSMLSKHLAKYQVLEIKEIQVFLNRVEVLVFISEMLVVGLRTPLPSIRPEIRLALS